METVELVNWCWHHQNVYHRIYPYTIFRVHTRTDLVWLCLPWDSLRFGQNVLIYRYKNQHGHFDQSKANLKLSFSRTLKRKQWCLFKLWNIQVCVYINLSSSICLSACISSAIVDGLSAWIQYNSRHKHSYKQRPRGLYTYSHGEYSKCYSFEFEYTDLFAFCSTSSARFYSMNNF